MAGSVAAVYEISEETPTENVPSDAKKDSEYLQCQPGPVNELSHSKCRIYEGKDKDVKNITVIAVTMPGESLSRGGGTADA